MSTRVAVRRDKASPVVYAILAAVAIASLFPLYWSFVVSTRDNSVIGETDPLLLPGGNLMENVARVFDTVDFWLAMGNSFIVASTVACSGVTLAIMAGYAFAHLRFPGRNSLFLIVIGTAMVPAQLGVIPLYLVVSELGWYGRLEAVIVPGLVGAFSVFWMRQTCEEAIPRELIDTAQLDGCTTPRVLWHVVLPAVRPQAMVLAVLIFLTAWNDFFWPLVVLDPNENPTVQVALSRLASGYFTDYTLMLTGATLAVLPVIVLFILLARYVVAGVDRGGVRR